MLRWDSFLPKSGELIKLQLLIGLFSYICVLQNSARITVSLRRATISRRHSSKFTSQALLDAAAGRTEASVLLLASIIHPVCRVCPVYQACLACQAYRNHHTSRASQAKRTPKAVFQRLKPNLLLSLVMKLLP